MSRYYNLTQDTLKAIAARIAAEVVATGQSIGWLGTLAEVEALSGVLAQFNIAYTDDGTWTYVAPQPGPGLSDLLTDSLADTFQRKQTDRIWCRRYAATILENGSASAQQVSEAWRYIFDEPYFGLEGGH
jgi:hypothetical protein